MLSVHAKAVTNRFHTFDRLKRSASLLGLFDLSGYFFVYLLLSVLFYFLFEIKCSIKVIALQTSQYAVQLDDITFHDF